MNKCTISFELIASQQTGRLLLHLGVVLHQLRINPLSLQWSELDGARPVRLWLVVIREEERLQELMNALTETDGVSDVRMKRNDSE